MLDTWVKITIVVIIFLFLLLLVIIANTDLYMLVGNTYEAF